MLAAAFLAPTLLVLAMTLSGLLPVSARRTARKVMAAASPIVVVPGVITSLRAPTTADGAAVADGPGALSVPWMLFGVELAVDYPGRALLLIAALLYASALSAVTWLKLRHAEPRYTGLSALLVVCYMGNIGTYLAADSVTFYLSFALMSFAAAGLVVHYRSRSAHRAARIYLVMSVLSEVAVLAALLLTVAAGGRLVDEAPAAISASEHTGLIVGLLLFGFGVKAGAVPLHVWLPLAHPAAPPAASAVLSGAMVKAGMIGWIRFVPTDAGDASEVAGRVLLTVALLGAFAAVAVGLLQSDPKVLLAYSTVSQMAFIAAVLAAGLILPDLHPATTAAAIIYAVHHGLAKGALFLGVPVVSHYGHGVSGIVVAVGMVGAGLAVAGAPLTSGAFGKYVSKEAVAGISVLGVPLDAVLPLVATGSTLLLMRFAWVMRRAERRSRRAPDGELISWVAVAVAGIAVPWIVGLAWFPEGGPELAVPGWSASTVWDAIWPILLGLVLGSGIWVLHARGRLPRWVPRADGTFIAPGDLVVPEETILRTTGRRGSRGLDVLEAHSMAVRRTVAHSADRVSELISAGLLAGERRLTRWEASGLVVLLALGAVVAASVVIALSGGGGR
ncbi:proton-conducting transporter transmembrane domain-containing protein [Nesterenkonia marinintestina]|uniref:proton-conducting transporter transmembrane domain-containing protein n=1 Tax=Nesterenkonia marinintestina TaxID=2979865 RepID=UPI0021BF6061|nr:proton-conducting transporter membrane subunit [Nesterenkonia sp. GX14115]